MIEIKNSAVRELYETFRQNEGELVSYIERNIKTGHCVIGTHLAQLAHKYDLPLVRAGVQYGTLPEAFVSPNEFDNIEEFMARARFLSGSSVGRRRRFD